MRILFLLGIVEMAVGEYTFTYKMASHCKEHLCRMGYRYDTMYKVTEKQRSIIPGVEFEMHLAILAPRDGHILLSPTETVSKTDRVYEIVVGGGGNKFTELRSMQKTGAKDWKNTPGILSSLEFRAFWIRLTDAGIVEFGKEGEELALLSYADPDPLPINFFSFASWNGVEAKMLYDCPAPGEIHENDTCDTIDINLTPMTDASEHIDPQLHPMEVLAATFSQRWDRFTAPAQVEMAIEPRIISAKYLTLESKMETLMSLTVQWENLEMSWNPAEYNGTDMVRLRSGHMWQPKLSVPNSDSNKLLEPMRPVYVWIKSDGTIIWQWYTAVTSLCSSILYSSWPRDEYKCSIKLKPWTVNGNVTFNGLPIVEGFFTDPNDEENTKFIENDWSLVEVQTHVEGFKEPLYHNEDYANSKAHSQIYVITLKIRRNAQVYNVAFYTPLAMIMLFVLLSFWTAAPLSRIRTWFYLAVSVLLCVGLSLVDSIVLGHSCPTLVIVYAVVLTSAVLAMIIEQIMMHPKAQYLYSSHLAQKIILNNHIRGIFCLTPIAKECKSYNNFADPVPDFGSQSQLDDVANVEQMESDMNTKPFGGREEFAQIVNKIMFTLYMVLYAILVAYHY